VAPGVVRAGVSAPSADHDHELCLVVVGGPTEDDRVIRADQAAGELREDKRRLGQLHIGLFGVRSIVEPDGEHAPGCWNRRSEVSVTHMPVGFLGGEGTGHVMKIVQVEPCLRWIVLDDATTHSRGVEPAPFGVDERRSTLDVG
jgi:hypothetical protein